MNQPLISVICPVYNAEPYLNDCVASCLNQTIADIELVFVDDGSSDGSLELLKNIARQNERLRVFSQEKSGASHARNRGLNEARGEFVFFLDADDYIPEQTALERLYIAAKSNNVQVAGGSMCFDRNGVLDFDSMHGRELDSFSKEEVRSYSEYQYDYDFTRFIYSLDMLNRNGLRFPDLTQFEDPVFYVDTMIVAERFATIPDAVYAYRYGHQGSRHWSRENALDRLRGLMHVLEISREKGFAKMHAYAWQQLDVETTGVYLQYTDDDEVMSELFRANSMIDTELIQSIDPNFPDYFVIEPLRCALSAYRKVAPVKGAYDRLPAPVKTAARKVISRA